MAFILITCVLVVLMVSPVCFAWLSNLSVFPADGQALLIEMQIKDDQEEDGREDVKHQILLWITLQSKWL